MNQCRFGSIHRLFQVALTRRCSSGRSHRCASSSSSSSSPSSKQPVSPPWITSTPLTRKKSIFIARAAPVSSEPTAQAYLQHLLASDKKAAKATHNITAWRIRGGSHQSHSNEIQNSNDDGESAAGGKLLTLLQMMDAWDVMVVVSRWFGGVKLGPERFRAINAVAKEALDKGGWNRPGNIGQDDAVVASKTKSKKKKK